MTFNEFKLNWAYCYILQLVDILKKSKVSEVIMKKSRLKNVGKVKMGKFNSICELTASNRQKAISELNESDDLKIHVSSLRDKIKASYSMSHTGSIQ